ncbi:hypothetical protein [Bounagaea algeriensis]
MHTSPRHTPAGDTARGSGALGSGALGSGDRQAVFLPLTVQVARSAATADRKRADAPSPSSPTGAPDAQPSGAQPSGAQSSGAQPSSAQSSGAQSSGAQPSSAQPSDAQSSGDQPSGARETAQEVRRCAEAAEFTAYGCWNALRGGCRSAERTLLPARLDDLVQAASEYVDLRWWHGSGSPHRRRVAEAQQRIDEAVHEGDGAEFAEAFVGYDQALATAMVSARSTVESSTR